MNTIPTSIMKPNCFNSHNKKYIINTQKIVINGKENIPIEQFFRIFSIALIAILADCIKSSTAFLYVESLY